MPSRTYRNCSLLAALMGQQCYRCLAIMVCSVSLVGLAGCQSLPDNPALPSFHQSVTADQSSLMRRVVADPKLRTISALHPLEFGVDAFSARLALIELAQQTLDLQYYIWHDDDTGASLSAALLKAADRGVRVRILLDDIGSPLGDERLLMLDQHPQIDIRLFNPVTSRNRLPIKMASEFSRINRRMHNKSLTVDNAISIVGGRNIGDEYFDANTELGFSDLDVMVAGKVVPQISASFDEYWNFTLSYPVSALSKAHFSEQHLTSAYNGLRERGLSQLDSKYLQRIEQTPIMTDRGSLDWYYADIQLAYDAPAKILESPEQLPEKTDELSVLAEQLPEMMGDIKSELIILSPYFIPGDNGVAKLAQVVAQGARVVIITNSLAATDVSAVHAGYSRYRKDLLQAGVELYELRVRGEPGDHEFHLTGSSRASLHAKAFFLDRRRTFVGSMNLDPRSIYLNTEVGVVINSEEFTTMAAKQLLTELPAKAYRLALTDEEELIWQADDLTEPLEKEPDASVWRRLGTWFIGLFPIESQL